MVGSVVMRRSSMIRGFVRATYAATRLRGAVRLTAVRDIGREHYVGPRVRNKAGWT
jgi:hypothetical protein